MWAIVACSSSFNTAASAGEYMEERAFCACHIYRLLLLSLLLRLLLSLLAVLVQKYVFEQAAASAGEYFEGRALCEFPTYRFTTQLTYCYWYQKVRF
jgi:hypothetical protein